MNHRGSVGRYRTHHLCAFLELPIPARRVDDDDDDNEATWMGLPTFDTTAIAAVLHLHFIFASLSTSTAFERDRYGSPTATTTTTTTTTAPTDYVGDRNNFPMPKMPQTPPSFGVTRRQARTGWLVAGRRCGCTVLLFFLLKLYGRLQKGHTLGRQRKKHHTLHFSFFFPLQCEPYIFVPFKLLDHQNCWTHTEALWCACLSAFGHLSLGSTLRTKTYCRCRDRFL